MRRGYVFSALAFIIAAVVISGISIQRSGQDISSSGLESHIHQTNAFLLQLEEDVPRALAITSYRSLLGLEEHVSSRGEYLDDLEAAYREVMSNGSVNGTAYAIMENATLQNYTAKVAEIARGLGLRLDLTLTNITATHTGPFTVFVNATVLVNVSTLDGDTRWEYNTSAGTEMPIGYLKDPLYAVGTLGRLPAVVLPVNQSEPYVSPSNDTTRLQVIYNNTQYVPNTNAPSFLMRFEGDFGASEHGISSLVRTQELDAQGIPVQSGVSVVDYLYFDSGTPGGCTIVNMPDEYRDELIIDAANLGVYDAVDATTSCS